MYKGNALLRNTFRGIIKIQFRELVLNLICKDFLIVILMNLNILVLPILTVRANLDG